MMVANFLIDFGQQTLTDKMNESRYFIKFCTFLLTATLTNIGVNLFIKWDNQFFQTPLNKLTNSIDLMTMLVILVFLTSVHIINRNMPRPKNIDFYLTKMKGFQQVLILLVTSKYFIVIFGGLYMTAVRQFRVFPKETNLSNMLLMFQFFQYSCFFYNAKSLYNAKLTEKEVFDIQFNNKGNEFKKLKRETEKKFKNSNTISKSEDQFTEKMRIVLNPSFKHKDAYIFADKDLRDEVDAFYENNSEQNKVEDWLKIHHYMMHHKPKGKEDIKFPYLTYNLKSNMRCRFYLD